jgi:hypothetical protein
MKVQYTIPAVVAPQKDPLSAGSASEVSSFRSRLQQLITRPSRRWKEVLQLDVPPRGIEWIAAPPRPEDLTMQDAESLRQQWRELLNRYALKGSAFKETEPKGRGKIQQMLRLLIRYHVMEQELAARYLSEGR